MKSKSKPGASRYRMWSFLFCAPNIILFIVFFLIPAVIGVWYSFTNYNGLSRLEFIGLQNYDRLFHDVEFYSVLLNTIKYTVVSVPLCYVVSLGLALLLANDRIRGNAITRILVYWPTLLSSIMVGVTWKWLFSESYGFINYMLTVYGIEPVRWFSNPTSAFITTIVASAWSGCGVNMLIFIAGLLAIPDDYYEAAMIEGAGVFYRFIHITLPLIVPAFTSNVTLLLAWGLKLFDLPMAIARNMQAAETVTMFVYDNIFSYSRAGFGQAAAILFTIVLLILTRVITWLFRRKEVEL